MVITIRAVRHALIDRIGPIDGVTMSPFIPDAWDPPIIYLKPDMKFIDYEQVFASGRSQMNFLLSYATSRISEEEAQDDIDEFLDPVGQVVGNLQAPNIDDDLSRLVSYVQVLQGSPYRLVQVGGTAYIGAQLQINVMV